MAIFDRIRRSRTTPPVGADAMAPIPLHLLPEINQRITIAMGEHAAVASRVEDVVGGTIQIAFPALPLEFGDSVVVTWEREDVWFSLDTRVLGLDERAAVPTIKVVAGGRLSRYDERRADVRRQIELPLELRVVRSRAVRPGHELRTATIEVSSTALRFASSAPFAPDDLVEARLQLPDGDTISARVRIIRVDAVSGSWRSTCTAAFDEILRSDRARIMAVADSAEPRPVVDVVVTASTAPTLDGVGGRDEPVQLGSMEGVVEWLRRRS